MRPLPHTLPSHSVASLELDKAKTAIEQFIYSCSHTLRAPLKSIAGLVYLLKNTASLPDVDPEEYLRSIETTVGKMESLLNELEQFLCNSRSEIALHSVDVRRVIEQQLKDVHHRTASSNVKVVTHTEQSVKFFTDASKFQIVLSHVLANAIAFHDATARARRVGIQVHVSSAACRITVRDNGIGITREAMPRIFDLFYRGSQQSAGSGVGLYIVSEVMKKLGGEITVQSKAGKGTCVTLVFPNLSL